MDFPALSPTDGQNGPRKYAGDELQQNVNPYRSSDKDNMLLFKSSSSIPSRGGVDFASAVRKLAAQDSGVWKYERNSSTDAAIGSSRSAHALTSNYSSGHGRGTYGDRLQSRGSARAAPVWLETGDAVANMYSERREEARDHARLRNAYFEQGFYVGERPVKSRPYIGSGITRHSANDEKAIAAAKFAVEASDHNKGEDCGGRLGFKKVVRVNTMRAAVFVYYITLQGSDQCFYEAKVLENIHHST
ncbi:hypothetical protein TorRG33x02_281320 [Trema orientale]|uniref:Uncharacterized protein n=1 Tax=Trema orientale TaxID=63057 RepID=A0A2P5CKR6_TREOI|nr:hypothetical protein TorRG33x02_281320 [Trema orientale]